MRAASVLSTAHGTRREAFGPVEWALLASIALMWGSSFVFIELGLEHFSPGLVAFLRILLGTAAVAILPKARARVAREDWPRVATLGVVWMAIPLTLFPIAQLWIDSSLAGMLNGAMPLFAGLIATLLLRRAPRPVQIAGLLLGFTGVVLLSWPAARGATGTLVGAILVLLATVLYGLAANMAVPLQQKYGSLPVVFRAQLTALIALLPVGLLSLPSSEFAWSSTSAMLALGIFGSGVAFAAMATLVGRAGATRGAVAIYFIPVVAILLGVTLLDERVEMGQLVGMALVLAGAWLTSRRER
ncbi:MAG TPA: DMT family transporter [Actinomycetota bacterium]|jgi:drug/metabolite transporter (DMT)-like permease|nr:DMT family transporter [Actinomycetota bacterium]